MFNQNRTREFQSGLKHEERRRSRQDDRLKLRRADRENRLQKKRQTLQHRRRDFNGNNQQNGGSSQNGSGQVNTVRSESSQKMLQQLPQFVQGCYSDHPAAQFECTQRIRKLLSIERDPPIQEVINSGVVTRLIQFLDFDNYQQLQFEAAWALTNIASGKAEETAVVVRYGAVPKFVRLMGSQSEEVKEQVIWALGNISGDSPELRNLVLSHNAMDALLQVCDTNNMQTQKQLTLQRNLTWTLSNFCRGKPQPKWEYTAKAIRALKIMLTADDDEILQDACWAFSYLSDIDVEMSNNQQANQQINAIYSSGALARLVQLLESANPHIRHPALRSIGNIATGTEEQTQWVINLGVLKKLQGPLQNDRIPIKRETCWLISNITAGSPTQIEAVISANLIPPLINVLKHSRFEVAKEASWCLSNVTSGGSNAQIKFLVNQGIIGPMCQFLRGLHRNKGRAKLKMATLEALDNILKVGRDVNGPNGRNQYAIYCEEADCDQILEELQADNDNHEQIFDIAGRLMKEYFDGEEGYIDDGPSNNNNNGFNGNQNQNNNNSNNNNGNNNGWNVNNNQNNNNTNNPFGGSNNNNNNGNQFGFGIGGNGFNDGWNGNNNNNNNGNNSTQNFTF